MADPVRSLLSQTSYNADGVTTVWNFSFAGGYIDRAHVKAQVLNKSNNRVTQVAFAWVGDYQVRITPAIAVGFELTIYRDTPKNVPLVDFADRANLTEAALDLNAKQAIFTAAESNDQLAVALDSVSQITNAVEVSQAMAAQASASATTAANAVASAVAGANVAIAARDETLGYRNSAATSATQAGTARDAAQTAAGAAGASRDAAATSASTADTRATAAASSASAASTSAGTANSRATDANTSAQNASMSAQTASTAASTATTKAGEASTSATNAKASQDAAKASADSAAASAAVAGPVKSVNTRNGDVTLTKTDVGLQNVDNVKQLPAAGGTLSGNLTLGGYANPAITLNRPSTASSNVFYGSTNGVVNWALMLGQDTSNVAGFYRYNQSTGAYIDRPLSVQTNGTVEVTNTLQVLGPSIANQFYTQAGAVNPGFGLVLRGYANTPGDRYVQAIFAQEGLGTDGNVQFRHVAGQFAHFNVSINGQVFTMASSGQGSSAAGWVATSDFRVKYDNKVIPGALAKVLQLVGYTGLRPDLTDMDLIVPRKAHLFAQDVLKVLPEAVVVPKNYDPVKNTGDLLSLDYNGVIPLLVEAMKELHAKVQQLEAKINT